MQPAWIIVLLTGLMGGNNELLNYIPTDTYWQAKHVAVSGESMLAELTTPVANPKDAAKAAAVRKLMAIRTLGELKHKAALPKLEPLLKSDEMFVADYARTAIQAMGSKVPALPLPEQVVDARLLPADLFAVASIRLQSTGKSFDYAPFLKVVQSFKAPATMPAGPTAAGDDGKEFLASLVDQGIQLAERTGNIRLNSVTVGVSELAPNAKTGRYAVWIFRGQYDRAALLDTLKGPVEQQVGDLSFLKLNERAAVACISDHYLLQLVGDAESFPREAMAEAFKKDAGKLQENKSLWALVDSISNRNVWAVLKDSATQLPEATVLAPFHALTLEGSFRNGALDLKIVGKGKDPAAIAAAVEEVNKTITGARKSIQDVAAAGAGAGPGLPRDDPYVAAIESIKCSADQATANLTATIPQLDAATVFTLVFLAMR